MTDATLLDKLEWVATDIEYAEKEAFDVSDLPRWRAVINEVRAALAASATDEGPYNPTPPERFKLPTRPAAPVALDYDDDD